MTGLTSPDGELMRHAALLSGADMSHTRTDESGVPALTLSDGPNGLAMNLPDWSGKVPATCFPAPVALAASWDVDLVHRVAAAIGREARVAGADILLGPSINIKRSPLGGRGFEYYSEDPFLAGRIGAGFVAGVQSAGVGACVKHFAVNSQETDRMRVSAELSERALREIYLAAFEHVVTSARPAMVMASYNRVNGTYVTQDRRLLTEILRDEWGFGGAVVSDWGAVDDRLEALRAGLDLEMPGPADASRRRIVAAVENGDLDASVVVDSADRLRRLAVKWGGGAAATANLEEHHLLAVAAAAASIVLLKNDGVLPLSTTGGRVAVIGELARTPQIQGGGSANASATRIDSPLAALRATLDRTVDFAPGYSSDPDQVQALADEAVRIARDAEVTIVFLGPDEGSESEGYDRDTLELPAEQVGLLTRIAATGTRTVAVLDNGGIVLTSPWSRDVGALVEAWLPGQGGGTAIAQVLTGAVNPSGRLTETIPLRLADTPAFASFPGHGGRVFHGEGIFVGYRGYDHAGREVAFPFGHGLSYTSFAYEDIAVVADDKGLGDVLVELTVRNVGNLAGADVWQVYLRPDGGDDDRPVRTLAAFGKVELEPGATARVRTTIGARSFARWDERRDGWVVDPGTYAIEVGASSRDIRVEVRIDRTSTGPALVLTRRSTLREWLTDLSFGPALIDAAQDADPSGGTSGFLCNPVILTMIGDLPIERLFDDPSTALSPELLAQAVREAQRQGH
ncbi:glycoside hydrolase family 3 C-terminal domain-containing protein [Cellulomonas sp. URHD0024]|uniref:glycoside hydrolase family 3 C-terminal domain-containing protein n=1 Tax=Cellulomonas sp. URHD0024 TaxID=1302620 RepID=UPI00041F573B|nr:glycoside hydrolase family 3 C-terminal domain-containing protein [Cellulomonas sp. URHD0024]